MNVIFTVCNRYTLANARVLADSVKQHMPQADFYLCWVDNPFLLPAGDSLKKIGVDDIAIPDFQAMAERYFDYELVAACRPWFARYLLDQRITGDDLLTFLAPTSWLLAPMAPISADTDLMLTPNISKPLSGNKYLDDKRVLNIGMYHSGAWTLRKREATQKFVEWWSVRTLDRAKFDLCNGMCLDQLWLNYAPVLVPATTLNRAGSWHFGLHSIPDHVMSYMNGQYLADQVPLISVDFAGMQVFDPVWSEHRQLARSSRAFVTLFERYEAAVRLYTAVGKPQHNGTYGTSSGMKAMAPWARKSVSMLDRLGDFIDEA